MLVDGAIYDFEAGEWREIPQAPGGARCGAAVAMSAGELLVYGGYDSAGPPMPEDLHGGGVLYDLEAGEWRQIPAAPVSPRWGAVAAWTGSELVVWGGTGPDNEPLADGAAYDPEAGEWRAIAESPLTARTGLTSAWIGDELVVFGGRDLEDGGFDAAAYDPDDDAWRELSDVPVTISQAETAWTGDVLYVLGSVEEPDAPVFLAYVPDDDAWVERPDPPAGERRNHGLAWTGAQLALWGGQSEEAPEAPGAVWSPSGVPTGVLEVRAAAVVLAALLVVLVATGAWLRAPTRDACRRVSRSPASTSAGGRTGRRGHSCSRRVATGTRSRSSSASTTKSSRRLPIAWARSPRSTTRSRRPRRDVGRSAGSRHAWASPRPYASSSSTASTAPWSARSWSASPGRSSRRHARRRSRSGRGR